MNTQIVAVLFQEGGKLLSEFLRSRPRKRPAETSELPPLIDEEEPPAVAEEIEGKKAGVATGCVPCSLGHLGTCSGLLNEAMRFARKDGLGSDEVIGRINACMDEISSLERVDLRPEKIVVLPQEERRLANIALLESRDIRHGLEEISTVDELEALAAKTQTVRNKIGTEWFRQRLAAMPEKQKKELAKKAAEKVIGEFDKK